MNNPCPTENDKRMIWTINEKGDCRLWGLDYNKRQFIDKYQNDELQFPSSDKMILNKLPIKTDKKQDKNDSFINLLKSQCKKSKDKSMDRGILLSHFNVNINGYNNKNKKKRKRSKNMQTRCYGDNKNKIKCIKGHYDICGHPWIGIGGNDRPVEIWDFNKQKCIFKGKHHYHYLGHKHEITINDIDFSRHNKYLCAAVTSQSELKLYDIRSNKSMLIQKIGDYSLNKILIKSQKKVVIGDSNGNIFEFDYLKPAKERGYVYRRYRGFVGAIRDFDIHPTRNLLASVGLGRYVVVHRFNQPHLPLFRTYLKQKLNAVLFGITYDTKYLPQQEEEEEKKEEEEKAKHHDDGNGNIDSFLNDDDEDNDEEDDDQDEDVDIQNWNEKLDGYDTDELQELLNEIKAQKHDDESQVDSNDSEPSSKRRKLNN